MKCGSTDYHFIRKDENGWYTKSGQNQGIYIPDSIVLAPVWYAMRPDEYGMLERLDYNKKFPIYEDETIYFAITIGWDGQ